MALANHLLTAWVWKGKATDKHVGFVTMTKAAFDAAKTEGRAQDPRVGALHLKYITRALYVPVGEERGAPPEPAPPEPAPPEPAPPEPTPPAATETEKD